MKNLLTSQKLQPVASLEGYINWVNQIAPLTEEEERALADDYKKTGNVDCARKMVLSHLKYVVYVAKGYMGYGLALADLVQEGNVGLMEAVKRFDPNKGARLATFSLFWIKSKIHDYITKNWRIVKTVTTKPMLKLFFKLRSSLNSRRKQYLTEDEVGMIAQAHGVKPRDVRESEYRILTSDLVYAGDEPVEGEASGTVTALVADRSTSPDVALETSETKRLAMSALKKALCNLDERSQAIVVARWLSDEGKEKLKVLADRFGISVERVRQIEKQALQALSTAVTGLLPQELHEFLYKGDF
tara:strand:- start:1268 stop:2170 length:903 start_codon:yes stop_codon:yes gene_type:complete